jgi:hypothetical protein
MITYDPGQPLIGLHIPKTAGTSFGWVLEQWFPGESLLKHYRKGETLPVLHELRGGVCVYGHFNAFRKFGVHDYYPKARQYFCFLREPYARFVSQWLYLDPNGEKDDPRAFERWLAVRSEEQRAGINSYSFIWHFPVLPRTMPAEVMFDEYFVFVGLVERLQRSVDALAAALHKPRLAAPRVNVSERPPIDFEAYRSVFERSFSDEVEIYQKAVVANDEMTAALIG